MEAARSRVTGFFRNQENVIHMFLVGALTALAWRSSRQQKEIDALEAEKLALQSGNKAMSSAMWEWRDHLFHLAESDPSATHIPLSRLRSIYAEEENPASPSAPDIRRDLAGVAAVDETTIA